MCPFYNAELFEITGAAKGVFTHAQFTHSQSPCHIAKVVLALTAAKSPQRLTCHLATRPRGCLHWRLSDDGPGASRIVPIGRHPKPFTKAEVMTTRII
jgi:hypothetical protein